MGHASSFMLLPVVVKHSIIADVFNLFINPTGYPSQLVKNVINTIYCRELKAALYSS